MRLIYYSQHDEALVAVIAAPVRRFVHEHVALDVVRVGRVVLAVRTVVEASVALTLRNLHRGTLDHRFLEICGVKVTLSSYVIFS